MTLCMKCSSHATFNHTVFQGTAPTTIKLCEDCAAQVDAEGRLASIKDAPDHATKDKAVADFLAAVTPAATESGSDQAHA